MDLHVLVYDVEDYIAGNPSKAKAQTPQRMQHIADKFRPHRTPIAKRATPRRPGAEIKILMCWIIIREYHQLLSEGSCLPLGGLKSLHSQFPD